ncbi:MAG TPA: VOC family protein [Candidatus Dojkabacteria bacterium]|jgi:catechol 2,3-dioxygenase-like lactoylglutathione lyase family enzyme
MKLNAVAVSSNNIEKTIEFYRILGFEFPDLNENEDHIESTNSDAVKLMIDSKSLLKEIIGEMPKPANHSSFAIQYDSPEKVNKIVKDIESKNFKLVKKPWDAFWGQRYAIVEDPDGYKVDLYAYN